MLSMLWLMIFVRLSSNIVRFESVDWSICIRLMVCSLSIEWKIELVMSDLCEYCCFSLMGSAQLGVVLNWAEFIECSQLLLDIYDWVWHSLRQRLLILGYLQPRWVLLCQFSANRISIEILILDLNVASCNTLVEKFAKC